MSPHLALPTLVLLSVAMSAGCSSSRRRPSAMPDDAGVVRDAPDAGRPRDAGPVDGGRPPPSRCGLDAPVDLDGDGVPFVDESTIALPATFEADSTFPRVDAAGGTLLALFECPGEGPASCAPTVVLVDETGVHAFDEPGAPLSSAPGWTARRDVVVTDDGTGWLLHAGRVAGEAENGRWVLWSFSCGDATRRAEGTGRLPIIAGEEREAIRLRRDIGDPPLRVLDVFDQDGEERIVDAPWSFASATELGEGASALAATTMDGFRIVVRRGDGTSSAPLDGRDGLVWPSLTGAARWTCLEDEDGVWTVPVSPEGIGARSAIPAAGCASAGQVSVGRDLWLRPQLTEDGPRPLMVRARASDALVSVLADAPEVDTVLAVPGGWYVTGRRGDGAGVVWFVAREAPEASEVATHPGPVTLREVRGEALAIGSGSGLPAAPMDLLWLSGDGRLVGRWTFPDEVASPLVLGDGTLRAFVAPPGARGRVVTLPEGGGAPVTVLDRVGAARPISVGSDFPALLATCPEAGAPCAIRASTPTGLVTVADDLDGFPGTLASRAGPRLSEAADLPWLWARRSSGDGIARLVRRASPVPEESWLLDPALGDVVNPPTAVADGVGTPWILATRALDVLALTIEGDDLVQQALGARGVVLFNDDGDAAAFWLSGGGAPAVACPLAPAAGRCEDVPAIVQPVDGRDPLTASDGRLYVIFADEETSPDRRPAGLWRSRRPR